MTHQVKIWEGALGKAYTDQVIIDYRTRLPSFREMLDGLPIKRVLEVGCNRGHNLVALAELLGEGSEVVGVEPNKYALEIARASSVKIGVLYGHASDLPFKDEYFDLVFTAGVLIHVRLLDLAAALTEIYRVSKRYILAVEYFAEEETNVSYRGHENLLWRRDFLMHYQSQFPSLALIRNGHVGPKEGFGKSRWWLLERRYCTDGLHSCRL